MQNLRKNKDQGSCSKENRKFLLCSLELTLVVHLFSKLELFLDFKLPLELKIRSLLRTHYWFYQRKALNISHKTRTHLSLLLSSCECICLNSTKRMVWYGFASIQSEIIPAFSKVVSWSFKWRRSLKQIYNSLLIRFIIYTRCI